MDDEGGLTTLTLGPAQLEVLRTLLMFHQDDEPGEFYPYEPFKELCGKVGVKMAGE